MILMVLLGGLSMAGEDVAGAAAIDGKLEGGRRDKPTGLDLVKYAKLRVPPAVIVSGQAWPRGEGAVANELRRQAFLRLVANRQTMLIVDDGTEMARVEYRPFHQGEDLAFEKEDFRQLLIIPPEGYVFVGKPRGGVSRWGVGALWDERRSVFCEIMPRRGSAARLLARVFSYGHPIDSEFVTGMAQSRISDHLKPHMVNGSMVLSDWATPGHARLYAWMSGERVVYLDLAGVAHEADLLRPFLEKYPPTWPTPYTFDINRWHERLIAEALSCLRAGLSEPPPRLRYSFDDYQFERGMRKIHISTLPDHRRRQAFQDSYESGISTAFETHILGLENRLDGDAYKTAVQAARQQAITTLEAWRDELRAAGGVELTKGGYQVRGAKLAP